MSAHTGPSKTADNDQYERDLPRLLIEQQRDAEEAEARARKRLRQRLEGPCGWPPVSPHDYDASDLRRLGFDGMAYGELYDVARDEVLARLDATEPNRREEHGERR